MFHIIADTISIATLMERDTKPYRTEKSKNESATSRILLQKWRDHADR